MFNCSNRILIIRIYKGIQVGKIMPAGVFMLSCFLSVGCAAHVMGWALFSLQASALADKLRLAKEAIQHTLIFYMSIQF